MSLMLDDSHWEVATDMVDSLIKSWEKALDEPGTDIERIRDLTYGVAVEYAKQEGGQEFVTAVLAVAIQRIVEARR